MRQRRERPRDGRAEPDAESLQLSLSATRARATRRAAESRKGELHSRSRLHVASVLQESCCLLELRGGDARILGRHRLQLERSAIHDS